MYEHLGSICFLGGGFFVVDVSNAFIETEHQVRNFVHANERIKGKF